MLYEEIIRKHNLFTRMCQFMLAFHYCIQIKYERAFGVECHIKSEHLDSERNFGVIKISSDRDKVVNVSISFPPNDSLPAILRPSRCSWLALLAAFCIVYTSATFYTVLYNVSNSALKPRYPLQMVSLMTTIVTRFSSLLIQPESAIKAGSTILPTFRTSLKLLDIN